MMKIGNRILSLNLIKILSGSENKSNHSILSYYVKYLELNMEFRLSSDLVSAFFL
jgi:hypothetical protein